MPKEQREVAQDRPNPIGVDPTGYEIMTRAVRALLNEFPGLYPDEVVRFEQVQEDGDICFSADNGALVFSETRDVLDVIHQECQYPFYIVYRKNSDRESGKLSCQEFLDTFGKWVCQEPVTISGQSYKLKELPKLSGGRRITRIKRDNSYGLEPQADGTQDWLLPVSVEYTNEFEL